MSEENNQPSERPLEPTATTGEESKAPPAVTAGQRLDQFLAKTKQLIAAAAQKATGMADAAAPKLKEMGHAASAKMKSLNEKSTPSIKHASAAVVEQSGSGDEPFVPALSVVGLPDHASAPAMFLPVPSMPINLSWALTGCLFLVLLSTFFPWFGGHTSGGGWSMSGSGMSAPTGPSGDTTATPFTVAAGLTLLLLLSAAATIALSLMPGRIRNGSRVVLVMCGLTLLLVIVLMTVGKPSTTETESNFGAVGWNTRSTWHLLWGAWFSLVFSVTSFGLSAFLYRSSIPNVSTGSLSGQGLAQDAPHTFSTPATGLFKSPLISWITDFPYLYLNPRKFYTHRGSEGSALQGLVFCVGGTLATCIVSLIFISAKIGGGYTPWRMAVYLPIFWTLVIAIRGCIIGLVIQAKTKGKFATSFVQGFTVDSFSWASFFLYWLVANIVLYATKEPPTTVGPYVAVAVVGLFCRLHGYFLDLVGLNTISGLNWAVAGVLMMIIDGISSIVIVIALFGILRGLFS